MSYEYFLKVHTGDERFGGTDSNIFIIMIGTLGTSPEKRLNGLMRGNALERNDTNSCKLKLEEDLGDIYQIKIRSDCAYGGSDWLLDYIDISTQDKPDKWTRFLYSAWIKDDTTRSINAQNLDKSVITTQKEITIKSENIIYVPANSEFSKEDSYRTKIGMKLNEVKVSSIATDTTMNVSGKMDAITASIGFALKTNDSTSTTKEITAETEVVCKQTLKLPASKEARKFRAIYTKQIDEYTISMGNLKIIVPDVASVTGAGFEEII